MADITCKSQTLASIDGYCDKASGGIKRVLIANFSDVTSKTLDDNNNVITTITKAPNSKFAEWRFRRETGSLTSTTSSTGGNQNTSSEATLVFTKMEAQKRLEIQTAINADAVMIVEDNNGNYWYMGYDYPVEIASTVATTGTALADNNNYTLTVNDVSFEMLHSVDPTIIAGLLTA